MLRKLYKRTYIFTNTSYFGPFSLKCKYKSQKTIFGQKEIQVKERSFAKRRIYESTDVWAGMGKAKSGNDMNTAEVRVEIIYLCKSTFLLFIDTVS